MALLQRHQHQALTPMCDDTRQQTGSPGLPPWPPGHWLLGPPGPRALVESLRARFQNPGQTATRVEPHFGGRFGSVP